MCGRPFIVIAGAVLLVLISCRVMAGADSCSATVPKEFVDALRLSELGPGKGDMPKVVPPKAAEQPGYAADETFPKVGKDLVEVLDFPKTGWKFKRDSMRRGPVGEPVK